MVTRLKLLAVVALPFLSAALSGNAQAAEQCSTVGQAQTVVSSFSGNGLVTAVFQSVPTDAQNCIPSYCVAAADESRNVKVAVGAGISEAYSQLVAEGKDDEAANLLGGVCSAGCDEVVVTAFAASQASTVERVCESAFGGRGGAGGTPAGELRIDAGTGAGGGQAASGN